MGYMVLGGDGGCGSEAAKESYVAPLYRLTPGGF